MSEIPNLFVYLYENSDVRDWNVAALSQWNTFDRDALAHMCIWPLVVKFPDLKWNWDSLSRNRSLRNKYIIPLQSYWNWEILSQNKSVSMRFIAKNNKMPWHFGILTMREDYDHELIYDSFPDLQSKEIFCRKLPRNFSSNVTRHKKPLLQRITQINELNHNIRNMSNFGAINNALVLPVYMDENYKQFECFEYFGMTEFEMMKHKCRNFKKLEELKDCGDGDQAINAFYTYLYPEKIWLCIVNLWNVIKIISLNFDKDGKIIIDGDKSKKITECSSITCLLNGLLDDKSDKCVVCETDDKCRSRIKSLEKVLKRYESDLTNINKMLNGFIKRLDNFENNYIDIISFEHERHRNEFNRELKNTWESIVEENKKNMADLLKSNEIITTRHHDDTPREVIQPGEFDSSLRDLLFKLPNKEWDFAALSRNRNINDEILLKFIDKPWNFAELSRNRNVSITFIITYAHFAWDWTEISSRPDITAAIVLEHADKPWDFATLSKIL